MEQLISHGKHEQLANITQRIKGLTQPILPIAEELSLLKQLQEFELGRFLLAHQGLNGYWTSYIVSKGHHQTITHPLEDFLLNSCPGILATQERFSIFQAEILSFMKADDVIASIPCGLMDDLLSLNYGEKQPSSIFGIDLDEQSLNAIRTSENVHLVKQNAWELDFENQFDLMTSNGLNIYEADPQRLNALYKNFHRALKRGGILVTSFITPPPHLDEHSPWDNFLFNDLQKQRAIYEDILDVQWRHYETAESMTVKLNTAGFEVIKIHYDSQHMFPTIVAQSY